MDDFLPIVRNRKYDYDLDWDLVALTSTGVSGESRVVSIIRDSSAMVFGREDDSFGSDLPLSSVFTRILKPSNGVTGDWHYRLTSISADSKGLFPTLEKEETDYSRLWSMFVDSLKAIESLSSCVQLLSKLKDLLYEYCWSVPFSGKKGSNDISLYDQSVTTMITSLALANSEIPDIPFRFVVGDLSGIQKFIFQSKNQSFRGAAKTFRGRSFVVSAISTAFRFGLGNALGLIPFFDLIDAGGRFTFLLPNQNGIEERLERFQEQQECFLFEKYLGTLSVVMDFSKVAGKEVFQVSEEEDKSPFQSLLSDTSRLLSNQKLSKFKYALKKKGFVFKYVDMSGSRCLGCGRKTFFDGSGLCADCQEEKEIGEKLPDAEVVVFSDRKEDCFFPLLENVWMGFMTSVSNTSLCYSFSDKRSSLSKWRLNMYVPDNKEFSDIARASLHLTAEGETVGKPFLSYIKIDVDNLGEIFIDGFSRADYTLSRYVTLSRMLNSFFNVHVRQLLKSEFSSTYTIISGGDDVFVLMPWNQATEFIQRMRENFSSFCCSNKNIHFSAGITLERHNTPFSICNEHANTAEHSAKIAGKNCVSLLGTTYSYEELKAHIEKVKSLYGYSEQYSDVISTAFLYREYKYICDWIKKTGNERKYEIIGLQRYDLARVYERLKGKSGVSEIINFFLSE